MNFRVMNCRAMNSRFVNHKALLLLCALLPAAAVALSSTPPPRQPNILLILLDDAGYSDVGVHTPRLQQLANEGVRFSRFYADSTCQTARLSLLTGQYSSRVALSPDFIGISPEVETLPERLRAAGYRSYHVGKWHLGENSRAAWPSGQGFDHWFGFLNQFVLRGPGEKGEMVFRRPTYEDTWLQRDDQPPQQYRGHLEDVLVAEVEKLIRQNASGASPWYINYWTFAPHHPSQAAAAYLKQFPDTPAGRYQALLKQVDDNMARVLKALEESGQGENTLVIVASDNGGTNEMMQNNGPYAGIKGLYSEGSTRTPLILRWPAGFAARRIKAGSTYDGIAAIYDLYPTVLAAAGIESDSALDGINLLPLLPQNKQRPAQALYWESGTHLTYQYSLLSADGRWRMDDGHLYDLEKDPRAAEDVAALYPQQLASMQQQFRDWSRKIHRVPLVVENLALETLREGDLPEGNLREGKTWRLTGDRFRRTPGDGAFTFTTSISARSGAVTEGTIAEQAGMWSLTLERDGRFRLRMNDQEMLSRPVALKACMPLVLSVYYSRSGIQPKQDVAVWSLQLGEEEVLLEQRPHPALFPEHFAEATFVGQDAAGKNIFSGQLAIPQIYNEFYRPVDPWHMGRDTRGLMEGLCPGGKP